ncbi:uncharacterized protein IWZ02DRAFT_432958 [Phyllosticta citriasiana]|uniref:uncharacterized protein n=1 Tax=Phyllosticta citriasiana TaxID=595635 RepID=UPI0030FD4F39
MLNFAAQPAVSEEKLAEAGFTPIITSPNPDEVVYIRHHEHQDRGSGAAASVSGPYTRAEAVSETRASLLRLIRWALQVDVSQLPNMADKSTFCFTNVDSSPYLLHQPHRWPQSAESSNWLSSTWPQIRLTPHGNSTNISLSERFMTLIIWSVRDDSTTSPTVNNILIKIVANSSVPDQDVVTLDLSCRTLYGGRFAAIVYEIVRVRVPLADMLQHFRQRSERANTRQAAHEPGATIQTSRPPSYDSLLLHGRSRGLLDTGFYIVGHVPGAGPLFLKVEARQPDNGGRWVVSGPWTLAEVYTEIDAGRCGLPDPELSEDDYSEEE